jgi:hypothetical protein
MNSSGVLVIKDPGENGPLALKEVRTLKAKHKNVGIIHKTSGGN